MFNFIFFHFYIIFTYCLSFLILLNFEGVIKFRNSIVIGLCILKILVESFFIDLWIFKFHTKSFVIQKV